MNSADIALKQKISSVLRKQGFSVKSSGFFTLRDDSREAKRKAHNLAKAERWINHKRFIIGNMEFIKPFLINGKNIKVDKIDPKIIEIKPGTEEAKIFRWWNLVWWSLPYERGYGRQMRFVIWDKYHNAPIGIIGLQSPILSWNVRDKYLGITPNRRDFWVNQSLNAQRIGALPPYNDILGGKLVALLMTTDIIRRKFHRKYLDKKTILKKRKLPPRLLFITTTGAYGKSIIYNRLRFQEERIVKFIGYTQGSGTFHIPNAVYEELIVYLGKRGYDVRRGYGSGPSRKLRLIDQALRSLDFKKGAIHGIQRAVYLFPFAKNLESVIRENKRPIWFHRTINEVTGFWKERWAKSRTSEFLSENFFKETLHNLKKCKKTCKSII